MSKVSSCIKRFTNRNWYPIISVDGDYVTIKKDNEHVILHPSLNKVRLFKRVGVPSNHRYEKENIHSTKCRCTECDQVHVELAQAVRRLNAPVYVSTSDTPDTKEEYNGVIKRFRDAGYNIAGVVDKNDDEAMKNMFINIKKKIEEDQ